MCCPVFGVLIGFLFSAVAGHFIIKCLAIKLRQYIGVEEAIAKLTPTLGVIERLIYTGLAFYGKGEWLLTFFGIKIAARVITFSKIENSAELENAISRLNVYFICNVLSLGFGVLGAVIIRMLTTG